jgi:hypothetical protein
MRYEHEDEHRYDEWLESLYEEHRPHAIDEFTSERLQSYFLAHPRIAAPAAAFLSEANDLVVEHPTASLIMGVAATETLLKIVLLKPVVHGLVHSESIADLVSDLVMKHTSLDRYKKLLFSILAEHGGVDLDAYKREGSPKSLWTEVKHLQEIRNAAVHRAEPCRAEDARDAISCGTALLTDIFPIVLNALGLHLHSDGRFCNKHQCVVRRELAEFRDRGFPVPPDLVEHDEV